MRLTDSTQVRLIAGGSAVAVFEPGKPALIIKAKAHAANLFPCGWQYAARIQEICPVHCGCEGQHGEIWAEAQASGGYVVTCQAVAVGFENGFICTAGHEHRNDAEYYEEEEVAARRQVGDRIAPNARLMDGRSPF